MDTFNSIITVIFLLLGIGVFLHATKGDFFDTLSPAHFIALGFYYYFFIPTALYAFEPWRNYTGFSILLAWGICFSGYLAALYAVPIRFKFLSRSYIGRLLQPEVYSPLIVLIAVPANWVVSNLARLAGGGEGGFAGQLLSLATQGTHVLPLVAACSSRCFKNRWLQVAFVLFTTFLLLLQVFIFEGSERRTIIRITLFAMLGIHFFISKISYKTIVICIICAMPLIYILRIEQAAKSWYGSSITQLSIEDFGEIETRWRDSYDGDLFTAFLASSDNAVAYDNTLLIVDHIGVSRYVWGLSYGRVFISLIPRSLWWNKPVSLISRIRHELPVASKSPHQSISLLGEAWWNFGPVGIILIPFVLSGMLKGLHSEAGIRARAGPSVGYCVVAPYFLENFRGGFGQISLTLVAAFFFMILFALASRYLVPNQLTAKS